MSASELLALRREAIDLMARLQALEAAADGQALIDGLKFRATLQRLARYGDISAIARLDREGEFTARGMDAAPAVSDILRIPRRVSTQMVAVARAVFPTTLDGQPVAPKLPATATVLATGEIDTQHADVIERNLSSDAARRIDPARWAAAEAQLADWARLYRPDELDRMARELIEQLDQDGPPPGDGEDQVNVLHLTKSRDGVGGRIKGQLDSVAFEMFARAIEAALKPDDQHKTLGERQADALGEICENALDEGRLPVKGGQRPHAAHRGRTAIHSMVLLCVTHHCMIHRTGWTVRMVDGWPEFIPPKWLDYTQTPRRKPKPYEHTRAG